MILAGVNVFRINLSHTNHADALSIISIIRKINSETGMQIAILGDLQGPKLIVGVVKKKTILKAGEKVFLTANSCESSNKKLFINYPRLIKDVKENDRVLIDDGKIRLRVLCVNQKTISCEIINGGDKSAKISAISIQIYSK